MVKERTLFGFVICWLSGIALGALFAAGAADPLLSLMRPVFSSRVSIVVLLLSAALPFLITAYAVAINRFWILLTVGFFKGFAFALCACVICRSFGTAGWLVQPMAQFTDTVLGPVFCLFGIRRCLLRNRCGKRDLVICLLICALAVIADYFLVSQFLAPLV